VFLEFTKKIRTHISKIKSSYWNRLELYLVAGQTMATIERDQLTWDALNLPVNFLPFLNSVKTCIVMLLQADCSTWPALFEYTGWLRHRRVF
jgi:hypothetical protein